MNVKQISINDQVKATAALWEPTTAVTLSSGTLAGGTKLICSQNVGQICVPRSGKVDREHLYDCEQAAQVNLVRSCTVTDLVTRCALRHTIVLVGCVDL